MKKSIIAIIAIAGLVQAGEYVTSKQITVTKQATVNVTATKFVTERLMVDLKAGTNYTFMIMGSYMDADGSAIESKVIRVTYQQAVQMMPEIAQVMETARSVVDATIPALLAQ